MSARSIAPVDAGDYLLLRLAMVSDARRTPGQLGADLKSRLHPDATAAALATLARRGLVATAPKVALTDAGRGAVTARWGALPRDRKRFESRVEPALALGLAPASDAAARAARPDNLRAIVLTRLYALPLDEAKVTMSQAVSALVHRAVVGLSPPHLVPALREAAAALPQDLSDVARLRTALIRLALALGADGSAPAAPADTPAEIEAFARRVLDITRTAHAGPFSHKTPIAHVYDVYGRRHADAGTLERFKQRLLRAAHDGHLALLPLDDSTTMDAATRTRSEIATPTGGLHFVERDT